MIQITVHDHCVKQIYLINNLREKTSNVYLKCLKHVMKKQIKYSKINVYKQIII